MKTTSAAKLQLVIVMLIFGTIGIFVRYLPLSSSIVALVRGILGTLFLLILMKVRSISINWSVVQKRLLPLCLSGASIGFAWILLFQAYHETTVAVATLCYYLAPIFVMLLSPIVLKEALTLQKALCILVALGGMVLVSGVLDAGFAGSGEFLGVLCGLGAAILYSYTILVNKKRLFDVPAFDKTIVQLGVASLAMFPYVLLTEWGTPISWTPLALVLLVVVGIIHTGCAYALYFGAIEKIPAQTTALFSYIDPISAIFLSAVFLQERLTLSGIVGAVLVLGSTLLSELPLHRQKSA